MASRPKSRSNVISEKTKLIKSLTKEVYLSHKQFPKGDYKDLNYVKKIVNIMYLLDQKVRAKLISVFPANNMNNIKLITTMDQIHTAQMKKILQKHGWVTISKFGKEAAQRAWLLVQHADHDPFFQAGCVFILEKLVKLREINQQNYAYLYDRAILQFQNLGLKQKYGTQVTISSDQIILWPYDGNISELNQRRHAIGLESIEEYLDQLKTMYIKK